MVLELPNYINSKFISSNEKRILKDFKENDFAIIYNASNNDIREAKRSLFNTKEELKKIPLEKIIRTLKKSMDYYFCHEETLENLSRLTGSPINYTRKSVFEIKRWILNIEEYIKMCFGFLNYDNIPIIYSGKPIAYRKYIPAGPVIGILPRNSEAVSIYLIVQILLSKNPCIIKTTSSLASNYSSNEFIKSLCKAIDECKDNQLEIMKKSINIVNIFNVSREELVKKLYTDKATYIVFGSNNTIQDIERILSLYGKIKIIKMGTGLSISIVFKDAQLAFSVNEICTSAAVDRGNDCISTNIVYVQEDIFNEFNTELEKLSEKFLSIDPFDENSIIGHINREDIDIIHTKLYSQSKHHSLRGFPETIHLSVIQLEEHDSFEEFPGPVLGVRKFKNIDHFYDLFEKDMKHNNLDKNLITSIYTSSEQIFAEISSNINSFTFKMNKGSEKINFLLEHQGIYILKELVDKRILEKL